MTTYFSQFWRLESEQLGSGEVFLLGCRQLLLHPHLMEGVYLFYKGTNSILRALPLLPNQHRKAPSLNTVRQESRCQPMNSWGHKQISVEETQHL